MPPLFVMVWVVANVWSGLGFVFEQIKKWLDCLAKSKPIWFAFPICAIHFGNVSSPHAVLISGQVTRSFWSGSTRRQTWFPRNRGNLQQLQQLLIKCSIIVIQWQFLGTPCSVISCPLKLCRPLPHVPPAFVWARLNHKQQCVRNSACP